MNPQLTVTRSETKPAATPAAAPAVPVVRAVTRADAAILIALCQEHADRRELERRPYGPARVEALELMEVLFEPPYGAWAWLAEADGEVVGYASATAGFSMLERAYCLQLDDPYVREPWRERGVETELLRHALDAARRFGCLNLQCQSPQWSQAARALEAPLRAVRVEAVKYVVRMDEDAAQA